MLKTQILSVEETLEKIGNKILLVNPPVVDSRYPWVKWNQPLDLLKLGTCLTTDHDCDVKLFDFMLPTAKGRVPKRHSKIVNDLPVGEPIRWHFGQPWERFDDYLDKLTNQDWIPDTVWITTLTSFWWQTVPLVANQVKNKLRLPTVILYGNYPVRETNHAAQFSSSVDIVVNNFADLTPWSPDFSLYKDQKPHFCAVDLFGLDPLGDIHTALEKGISHFCFFNDNIFKDFDQNLKPILEQVVEKQWDLQFHGICGIKPKSFPFENTRLLIQGRFSELHFEPVLNHDGYVDELLLRRIMLVCEDEGLVSRRGSGWESRSHYLSGFLWIGRPEDDLEKLVWNALKILQIIGMVIPKPYSPTPGTPDYARLQTFVDWIEPEDISPHRLPFAGYNKVEKSDYQDLYRLTAFLNMKVGGHTFDFLGNTYLAQVIRESISLRRWAI